MHDVTTWYIMKQLFDHLLTVSLVVFILATGCCSSCVTWSISLVCDCVGAKGIVTETESGALHIPVFACNGSTRLYGWWWAGDADNKVAGSEGSWSLTYFSNEQSIQI